MPWLDETFYDNTVGQWGIAVMLAVATVLVVRLFVRLVVGRIHAVARRTKATWDDHLAAMLGKTKLTLLSLIAIWVGALPLTLEDRVRAVITSIAVIALLVQGGIWVTAGLSSWLEQYRKREAERDKAAVTTLSGMGFVGKLAIWSVVALLALDNLGVDVTALVAGLGVGGIAVALAVQSILGDLFASLSIVLDKPFVIGDFLIIGDYLGTVEHVGLKTTRLRSLSGEQLVFTNSDLLDSRLRNYGRMFERRVVFSVGVTYETPRTKLTMIPQIIREAVEAQLKTRFDRSHFKAYGDFALVFETVYYVLEPEYNLYMDIQQAVNLRIHERFEAEEIEFAYPTQTLHLVRPEAAAAGQARPA